MTTSPQAAMHDMAQAAGCIFLAGVSCGWSAHPGIAEATGLAAIAAVSQSGPSRTNSSAAKSNVASVRKLKRGATRTTIDPT
ncbi:hypothetical protein [Sphingomonas lenta]|uniref:hypothetical protein n=1 Tax=Sphingomonas lenta TaxID=1141887 RepID=UPI001140A9D0|nr:hypothetical protein [Sphingomonas lenta]